MLHWPDPWLPPINLWNAPMTQYPVTHTAQRLKAMSNPIRLSILALLHREGEVHVGDLERHSGISQSAVSQHLRILRDNHLVTTRRAAQTIYYRLNRDEVSGAIQQTIDLIKD